MRQVCCEPVTDMVQIRNQIAHLFDDFGLFELEPVLLIPWIPPVDVKETEKEYTVRTELAGFKPEDIQLELQGTVLTIRGERKPDTPEEGKHVQSECNYGSFVRTIDLGTPLKQTGVKATYHDGVVEVKLPRIQETKPKQIKIAVERAKVT
ncbi:MAG: Hsp20/alpha crystallin family protein [Armatimonadota bacterium]